MSLEIRYDPITDTEYAYWPYSKYFSNYKFSPPIRVYDHWGVGCRFWVQQYYPTLRLFQHYLDYAPSDQSIRETRRFVYVSNPLTQVDTTDTKSKVYRPLNLYYDYYYPTKSLNSYADHWPNYDHLIYRYTYPSDRYYFLKGKIIYYTRQFTPDHFGRYKNFDPLSLNDFSSKFRNSSFWPSFRTLSEFVNDLTIDKAVKIQNIFDGETRLIRAQTASLLKKIHAPVVRQQRPLPITTVIRYDAGDGVPARFTNDNYIYRLLTTSPRNPKVEYTTYYSEPVRKYIGSGRLACVSYAGDRAYNRRNHLFLYEDPLKSDIQLLSYYINKFRQEKKAIQPSSDKVPLSPLRPSRIFSKPKLLEDSNNTEEMKELREARAARLANIYAETPKEPPKPSKTSTVDVEEAVKAKKKKDEARLAEEKALAEEQVRKAAQAKKEEAARKAELARQEELAAQAAAERAAELEKQAELARQQELAKQAEIERAKKEEEERAKLEEQKRLEDEARAEEERQQLLRLEELARQAEEEREAELARQAEELAELARQEAELAEQAKKQAEEEEQARVQAEQEELARQQAELEELERKEKELAELARQEAEVAEQAQKEAAALAQEAAELAELERQQAELDALEAEAKKLEEEATPPEAEEEAEAPAVQEEKEEEEAAVEEEEVTAAEEETPAAAEEEEAVVEEEEEEEE